MRRFRDPVRQQNDAHRVPEHRALGRLRVGLPLFLRWNCQLCILPTDLSGHPPWGAYHIPVGTRRPGHNLVGDDQWLRNFSGYLESAHQVNRGPLWRKMRASIVVRKRRARDAGQEAAVVVTGAPSVAHEYASEPGGDAEEPPGPPAGLPPMRPPPSWQRPPPPPALVIRGTPWPLATADTPLRQ